MQNSPKCAAKPLLFALLLASSPLAATFSLAQSGTPAAVVPVQTHDPRVESLLDMLGKTRAPHAAAISPDSTNVAWTVHGELHLTGISPVGAQDGAWERILSPDTIANLSNLRPGVCNSSSPAWSPDGKQLAFLSDCAAAGAAWQAGTQDNVFVWTLATNALRQLTHLHGSIDSIDWAPDGKSIAFLYVENATRAAGALAAMKPWSGVIGEDGVEIQRIAAVDLAGGNFSLITPATLHAYEFSWAPGSRQIVFVAAPPPGENTWWVAKLYTTELQLLPQQIGPNLKVDSFAAAPKVILDPATTPGPLHGLQIAVPRWSPDGKQIAFIGGLMSDQGATGGDIYLIPSSGGEPKNLTPDRPSTPAFIGWISDTVLRVSEHLGGNMRITALELSGHNTAQPTGAKDVEAQTAVFPDSIGAGNLAASVSAARNGDIAIIRNSYSRPPEVWAGPLQNLKQLTHLNDALKPTWGKAESVDWENDGFHVQGWLLYPVDYTPSKRYPLLVTVHGGPSSAVTPHWPGVGYGGVPFSALGYFVFMPNPRGSYGQGERFTAANVKDFGYGDLRDILTGIDVLEKRLPIDRDREGLTGWSYGGFMTMFAITQTQRFHAAVAGAGISDWQSYYGENSIDQWMLPFFGKTVYDDPAIYAKSSAIDFIHNARTPTLVVVGDRDGECPAPQSFEFWHALRTQGTRTQLVVYPNEGHAFHDPAHRRDVLERALNWFNEQMPAGRPGR